MSRVIPALIIAAIVALIFLVMLRAWRKRVQSASAFELQNELPSGAQFVFDIAKILYVATVRADSPLERVALAGLRFRGHADIRVYSSVLEIQVRGERPVIIPADRILSVQTSQVVIDKVVEPDGLMSVEWQWGSETLSTVFRVSNQEQRRQFARIADFIAQSGDSFASTESPKPEIESSNNA